MKIFRFTTLIIVFGLIAATGVFAQVSDTDNHTVTINIPVIQLLAIDGGNVTLAVQEPAVAGNAGTGDSDASTSLFYTSLVPSGGSNKITVEASGASVPGGTSITVEATGISATGTGGTAQAPVTFTNMLLGAQDFIRDIGSAYTGVTSGSDGAELTYTLSFTNFEALFAQAAAVFTVTYTITTQ